MHLEHLTYIFLYRHYASLRFFIMNSIIGGIDANSLSNFVRALSISTGNTLQRLELADLNMNSEHA